MKKSKADAHATMQNLLELARMHFTERGYAGASMEELVAEAKVTRGALYHHFSSKKGLFEAVLEAVQFRVGERVEAEASLSDDPWEQLLLGCRAFVTTAIEPEYRRILLIDGPAVLGWEAWRRFDEAHVMHHLREQLELLQDLGRLKPIPLDALTHFLSGALNESVLWISQHPDQPLHLEDTMAVISEVLDGLKA